MFELLWAEWPLHNIPLALWPRPLPAISIYYSPDGDNWFFLPPTRQFAPHGYVNFFFASRWWSTFSSPHGGFSASRWFFRLTSASQFFFASRRFASLGDIIIDLASPGQYHHQFSLTTVPLRAVVSSISPHRRAPLEDIIFYSALLAILSSILPHGCAPPGILFSIQPNGHAILAKYFSIWPDGCASPGKILLITYQGFLWAAFLQAALVPIPTWFFKASVHRLWCCLSCNAMQRTAFCIFSDALNQGFRSLALVLLFLRRRVTNSLWSFLTLTHLDDGPRFGLGRSDYKFRWYLNLGGTPLELVYMDIHNQPTELALSKSF
jgi:hypothetical protein